MSDTIIPKTELPHVSIIVPVYNTERYLAQCVESLLRQTLKNIEIILVDDGSTDTCRAMCDNYAVKDKRVKVIHRANSGYGKACNIGIKAARGEFFGIIESDDYVEPLMFERLYSEAKPRGLDVIRCHYYRYSSKTNTNKRVYQSSIPQNEIYTPRDIPFVFFEAPAVWSMLYRTDFVRSNGIGFLETSGASYQDTSFAFKALASADKFMLLSDAFVHYRVNSKNASSASKEKVFCVCDEYAEIERFIEERNLKEKFSPIIPKMKFSTYMWNYRRLTGENRRVFLETFAEEMRGYIKQKMLKKNLISEKDRFKIYAIAYLYPLYFFLGNVHNYLKKNES